MSANKHTPGPWLRDDRSGLGCDVRAASGRKVALCWGLASNNATNYRADYRAECDANAHLIAAAPELLEVAQLILAEDLLDFLPEEYASKVRAAIAKATGDAK